MLQCSRCIMKWMEIKETCPICQRNCRHENENGNASGGERTPLLTNPLDIWVVAEQQRVMYSLRKNITKELTYGSTQLSVFALRVILTLIHICLWLEKVVYLRQSTNVSVDSVSSNELMWLLFLSYDSFIRLYQKLKYITVQTFTFSIMASIIWKQVPVWVRF